MGCGQVVVALEPVLELEPWDTPVAACNLVQTFLSCLLVSGIRRRVPQAVLLLLELCRSGDGIPLSHHGV